MTLAIVVLAISLSLDALGVGIAYGFRGIRIPPASKIIICFFSILYSGSALIIGRSVSGLLPHNISKLAGIAILAFMGIWLIINSLFKKENCSSPDNCKKPDKRTVLEIAIKSLGITIKVIKNPSQGDVDSSGTIDLMESLMLGLALSVDAIGVGVGSALAGFYSLLIPVFTGLFQLLLLSSGIYLGRKIPHSEKVDKRVIGALPGILLIFLAIIRIY